MALLVAPLGYDSEVLSAINDRETAYQLALDAKAVGYIGNIDIKESPYSHVLSNTSVIGMIPAVEYGDKLEEMTIRFKISDAYTSNELGTYAAVNSELSGIKRLAIGYYSENLRICLPIETEYNEQTNEVYSTVTNQGTYCLIDMEKWFDMFGIEPEDLEGEKSTGGNSYEYSMDYDSGASDGQGCMMNYGESSSDDSYVERTAAMMQIGIDKWIYQTNGESQYAFIMNDMTWEEAKNSCESLGGHLVRIDNDNEQQFVKRWAGLIESNKRYWFSGFGNDDSNPQGWISGIRMMILGMDYSDNEYLYLQTGENFLSTYLWGNGTQTEKNYFICEWDPESQNVEPDSAPVMYFGMTFHKVPEEFGPISESNTDDYDNDDIPNNVEINFDLPNDVCPYNTVTSLFEISAYFLSETGCESLIGAFAGERVLKKMQNTYIVAINSDPTSDDTDGDRIKDRVDIFPTTFDSFPDRFIELINNAIVTMDTICQSYDGLYICMTPVGEIYNRLGCPDATFFSYDKNAAGEYEQSDEIRNTYTDPDDYFLSRWYFYAVIDKDGECAYSMMKLKPYEFGDVPGVHIPFASFEVTDFLYNTSMDDDEIAELDAELDRVSKCNIDGVPVDYNGIIIDYFKDPNSDGTYIVAELYIDNVADAELKNTNTMVADVIKKSDLININSYAMDTLEKYEVFPTNPIWIYDRFANTLSITDVSNLSYEEKICILACCTGNPNENSFAAEIVYHAVYAYTWRNRENELTQKVYSSAIKADLSAYEEIGIIEGSFETTYKRNGWFYVKRQEEIHGKK